MDAQSIVRKYYDVRSTAYALLTRHSRMVADKALAIACHVAARKPDLQFLEEAALLHDIGIFLTHAPGIDCHGEQPYICHGVLGRDLLEKEAMPKHALVCERHVGVGFSKEYIRQENLPLPQRDMIPESIEEQIICYADKFYSKRPDRITREKPMEEIRATIAKRGREQLLRFARWVEMFERP